MNATALTDASADPPGGAPPPVPPASSPSKAESAFETIRDFGDWLGPMMVKELRQGMRTRLFVTAFIVLQGVLAITLLTSLGAGGSGDSGVIFWGVLFVTLCVVMPMRGFGALANEDRLHTMDLILMTRLTSWRITFGKWAALVAQSALVVVSMLPYVVLRYFLGGVNVFTDLFWVGGFLVVSALLTAITVGFSAHSLFIVRAAAAVGALFLGGVWMVFAGQHLDDGDLPFPGLTDRALITSGLLAAAAYAIYYLLDMGASVIAPAAENHATRKRLSVVLVLGILFALGVFGSSYEWVLMVATVVGLVGVVDALNEEPAILPGIVAPFVRRGFLGRAAGRFLYPGWHAGLGFVFLVFLAFAGFLAWLFLTNRLHGDDLEIWHVFFSATAAVLVPAAFIRAFFPRTRHAFSTYLFIQGILAIYYLLIAILAESIEKELYLLGIFVPFITLAGGLNSSGLLEPMFAASCALTALGFLLILLRAIPVFRTTGEVERATAASLRAPAAEHRTPPIGHEADSAAEHSSNP